MANNRRGVVRITPELYAEIKSKLHEPSDDEKIMREYKIGKTTAQTIRNTANYESYRKLADRQKAERELDKITRNAKYDREEEPAAEAPKAPKIGVAIVEHHEESNALARAVGVFLVVCLLLIVCGITLGVLRWALKF